MAISAQLINDDRASERFPVEIDATVRRAARPYDVSIEDLSSSGFRMSGGPAMEIGTTVSIGFAGIGVHEARLMRVDGRHYGCEFVQPLSAADLNTAIHATPVTPHVLPTSLDALQLANAPEPYVEPYSPRVKLAMLVAAPIVLWGLIWAVAA